MRYIWQSGKRGRVMHIERTNQVGNPTGTALCGIGHRFNRSINAPFALGRKVCKNCEQQLHS